MVRHARPTLLSVNSTKSGPPHPHYECFEGSRHRIVDNCCCLLDGEILCCFVTEMQQSKVYDPPPNHALLHCTFNDCKARFFPYSSFQFFTFGPGLTFLSHCSNTPTHCTICIARGGPGRTVFLFLPDCVLPRRIQGKGSPPQLNIFFLPPSLFRGVGGWVGAALNTIARCTAPTATSTPPSCTDSLSSLNPFFIHHLGRKSRRGLDGGTEVRWKSDESD